MKVNMDSELHDLNGNPMENNGVKLTLKHVAIESLMAVMTVDREITGEEKFSRYELAGKLSAGGEIELTPEQASKIKQRIGLGYGPAVVGPAYKLLNG